MTILVAGSLTCPIASPTMSVFWNSMARATGSSNRRQGGGVRPKPPMMKPRPSIPKPAKSHPKSRPRAPRTAARATQQATPQPEAPQSAEARRGSPRVPRDASNNNRAAHDE